MDDLGNWPKENQKIRIGFSLFGVACFILGTVFAAGLGVPADMPGGTLTAGGVAMILLVMLPLSGLPLVVYVRYIRSRSISVLTGLILVGVIVYTFAFMVTSTSSTAALMILAPVVNNWLVVGGGILIDRIVRRFSSRSA